MSLLVISVNEKAETFLYASPQFYVSLIGWYFHLTIPRADWHQPVSRRVNDLALIFHNAGFDKYFLKLKPSKEDECSSLETKNKKVNSVPYSPFALVTHSHKTYIISQMKFSAGFLFLFHWFKKETLIKARYVNLQFCNGLTQHTTLLY